MGAVVVQESGVRRWGSGWRQRERRRVSFSTFLRSLKSSSTHTATSTSSASSTWEVELRCVMLPFHTGIITFSNFVLKMSKRKTVSLSPQPPIASTNASPNDKQPLSDSESPWKKLCFDEVEDTYLRTKPEPTSSLRLKRTKNVHFSNRPEIVEVPSRYDYLQDGIQLWWSRSDMNVFYRDSRASLIWS